MVHSASKIPFFALCNILETIQGKSSVAERRKALCEFVEKWREQYFDSSDPVNIIIIISYSVSN